MSDASLNYFVARGTNAERLAFTPVPPTPASGPDPLHIWYETDTGNTYAWDGSAWDQVNATAAAASTTEQLTGTDNTKRTTPDSVAALWEQGSDVASAGTVSLGEGGYFNITGTTTITDIDFATDKAGRKAWVKFAGVLTLTHNASTLILPTGANIATAAGDTACFVSEGSDVARCVAYQRASGAALAGGTPTFSGAMVKKSVDQTGANYSAGANIAWDAEVYDTGSFHDNVTNNTRLTTPAGATYVQVGCNLRFANVAASTDIQVLLQKTGTSVFDGSVGIITDADATSPRVSFCSGPIPVTGGTDYFEINLFCGDTSIDISATLTNFWIRVLA